MSSKTMKEYIEYEILCVIACYRSLLQLSSLWDKGARNTLDKGKLSKIEYAIF